MVKRSLVLLAVAVAVFVAAGCGGGGGSAESGNKTLTLGDIGWTESVAVTNLTKVVLEEDFGYQEVELKTLDVGLWYEGQTTFGLAVPSYMEGVNSIADLNESGAERIIGIEPGAIISKKIEENVIPDYNLTLEHEPSSTAAMLAEVERLYQDKEPFVFPPWCPNPMCGEVTGTF